MPKSLLEGVNEVLAASGEARASALDTGSSSRVGQAEQELTSALRRVLSMGWVYNTEIYEFTPDGDGKVVLPSFVLAWENPELKPVLRSGYLYSLANGSDIYEDSFSCVITRLVDWTDCPDYIQNAVIADAAAMFDKHFLGGTSRQPVLLRDAESAMLYARKQDQDFDGFNTFSATARTSFYPLPSMPSHDHNLLYSPIDHDHDADYADIAHTHSELHSHTNKSTLDKLSEGSGEFLYDGKAVLTGAERHRITSGVLSLESGLGPRLFGNLFSDGIIDLSGIDEASSDNIEFSTDHIQPVTPAVQFDNPIAADASQASGGQSEIDNMINGSTGNNWQESLTPGDNWVWFDIGEAKPIESVKINCWSGGNLDFAIYSSADDVDYTFVQDVTPVAETTTTVFSSPVVARYFKLVPTLVTNPDTWEIRYFQTQDAAIGETLILSDTFTAPFQPALATVSLIVDPDDAVVANTDYKVYLSFDGGTHWTLVTLTEEAYLGDKKVAYGTVQVTDTGTSFLWKMQTLNEALYIHLYGVSVTMEE